MFYFKRLVHSLFALTIIIGLSACSSNAPNKITKEANKESVQKVVKKIPKNEALLKVNQQLDELFTPVIGLF